MVRRRLKVFLGLLVILALVLSACASQSGGGDENQPKDNGGAKQEEKQPDNKPKGPAIGGELVTEIPDDPDTLAYFWLSSAYAYDVVGRVFGDGLLRLGYDLRPEPALAEALPEVGEDQKTYTFKLRKGIKFHDGTPVTAHDIVFSYEILMSEDYAGPDKYIVEPLEYVKALDDYTIEFKTKEVFAPFLFGTATLPPMPRHLLKDIPIKDMASADFWKEPIGAGPWKFVEWVPGQYALLERNPDYWEFDQPGVKGGKVGPWAERLRLKVIPESNTSVAALEAGELTYMTRVDPGQVDRLKQDYKGRLDSYDWNRMGFGYQLFNHEKWPTSEKAVRQALSYALNRQAIIDGVMDGKARIPAGPIPMVHWAYDDTLKGYPYDPQKAAEVLEAAGFKKNADGIYEKDGKPLKIKYVATKGHKLIEGIALQSQKDWSDLGVEMEMEFVEFNTLLKGLKTGDFNISFLGSGFSVDPHYYFYSAFHSDNIILNEEGVNQGSNRYRYRNEKVDQLIERGKTTVDIDERLEIYRELQRIVVDEAVANWIYVNIWTDFIDSRVKGVVNLDGYGIEPYMNQWYLREQ